MDFINIIFNNRKKNLFKEVEDEVGDLKMILLLLENDLFVFFYNNFLKHFIEMNLFFHIYLKYYFLLKDLTLSNLLFNLNIYLVKYFSLV